MLIINLVAQVASSHLVPLSNLQNQVLVKHMSPAQRKHQKLSNRVHANREWGPHRYTDITNPLPDNDSTTRFPISSDITGRLMELREHHIHTLEFLHHNGSRATDRDLKLLERRNDGSLAPVFGSQLFPSSSHLYFIYPDDRVYEVHFAQHVISIITFPRQVNLVVKDFITK
ncbi:hypothetical protein BDR03DRAFT_1017363 [Suillus americanus]|nr:hypothetical protein BDR03DRAFT_1017363 [Suillus americanus]